MVDSSGFRKYFNGLQANLSRGNATEHTHRPALKRLLESAVYISANAKKASSAASTSRE